MNRLLNRLGRYHCRKGVKAMFKFESYLQGYGYQYELEMRMDCEYIL
jgi:hypothetical protein